MRTHLLFALVLVAAAARLLLQMAATPPYAGLDESWHVARVAFVRAEKRQPTMREPSVPHYIGASMRGEPGAMPAFFEVRRPWPSVVAEYGRRVAFPQPVVLRPYEAANYEAQHPALYYTAAALIRTGDALADLRAWRFLSVICAMAVVAATASVAYRFLGVPGLLASALLVSVPTWLALVVRATDDALACAFTAVALAVSASAPRRIGTIAVEALLWAGAVATKLYTWPVGIAFLVFWRIQRGSRVRLAMVGAVCAASALLTMHELSVRTNNPFGYVAFDPATATGQVVPIAVSVMAKTLVATFIWTSAAHFNALTALGAALYAIPLLLLLRVRKSSPYFVVAAAVVLAFGVAQVVQTLSFVRLARAAGMSMPIAGKEGWYWYVIAPLLIGLFARHVRFAAVWVVAWDVLLNEGALFHDFAGTTSPEHPSVLFRWGPLHAPFTASLDTIGAGPLASHLLLLRLAHVAALVALFLIAWKDSGTAAERHSSKG